MGSLRFLTLSMCLITLLTPTTLSRSLPAEKAFSSARGLQKRWTENSCQYKETGADHLDFFASYLLESSDEWCGKSMMDNLIPTAVTAVPIPYCGPQDWTQAGSQGNDLYRYSIRFGTEKLRGVGAVQWALWKVTGEAITCVKSDQLPDGECSSIHFLEERVYH